MAASIEGNRVGIAGLLTTDLFNDRLNGQVVSNRVVLHAFQHPSLGIPGHGLRADDPPAGQLIAGVDLNFREVHGVSHPVRQFLDLGGGGVAGSVALVVRVKGTALLVGNHKVDVVGLLGFSGSILVDGAQEHIAGGQAELLSNAAVGECLAVLHGAVAHLVNPVSKYLALGGSHGRSGVGGVGSGAEHGVLALIAILAVCPGAILVIEANGDDLFLSGFFRPNGIQVHLIACLCIKSHLLAALVGNLAFRSQRPALEHVTITSKGIRILQRDLLAHVGGRGGLILIWVAGDISAVAVVHDGVLVGGNIFRVTLDTQTPAISVGSPVSGGGIISQGNRIQLADSSCQGVGTILQVQNVIEQPCIGCTVGEGQGRGIGLGVLVRSDIRYRIGPFGRGKNLVAVIGGTLGHRAVGKVLDRDLDQVGELLSRGRVRGGALDADGLGQIITGPLPGLPGDIKIGLALGRGADVGALRHVFVHIIPCRVVSHIQDDAITGRGLLA